MSHSFTISVVTSTPGRRSMVTIPINNTVKNSTIYFDIFILSKSIAEAMRKDY